MRDGRQLSIISDDRPENSVQVPESFSGFGLGAEWDYCNDRISSVLLKLGVGAQLVDRARRWESPGPILCGEFEDLDGLLHGFVDCVAGRKHARHIGKRHSVAAIKIFVDQSDVVWHRVASSILLPAGLPVDAVHSASRQVVLGMWNDHLSPSQWMHELVVGAAHRSFPKSLF
jgi:hypothetical protein